MNSRNPHLRPAVVPSRDRAEAVLVDGVKRIRRRNDILEENRRVVRWLFSGTVPTLQQIALRFKEAA